VFITPYFVFVHLQKTGGTFIRLLCRKHLTLDLKIPHAPASAIPPEFGTLPVFAVIRNPWDWYVSWYCWIVDHDEVEGVAKKAGLFNGDDFAEIVRGACRPHPDRPDWDWDLYTWLWEHSYRRAQRQGMEIEVGRFENLRGDFVSFLDRHDVPGEELRQAVLAAPAANASERNSYRDYYDDALRDLVGTKTQPIIRLYGYSF
jgi:hypothetical protein